MLEPASKNSSSAYQSLEDLLRRPLLSHSEDKEDNDNNDDADAAAEEPPHAAACMEDDDDEDEHDSEATTRVPHTGTSTLDHPRQRGGGCCAGSIVRRRPRSKPHRHQLTAMLSNYATSYNVVNISLVVPILQDLYYPPQQPDEDRHDAQIAAIAAALLAGMIVGQVLGGVCGDCAWLGKRLGALRWMLVIQVVAALASGFCRRHNSEELLWAIAAWRFVLGIGCGGVYPLAAVLSAEDHPSSNTTMQNNNNNTNNTNNTNNNPLPTSIAGSSAAALERVVLTFSTQGVGFVSVPLVAVIVLHCTENLELVWRLLLGLGAFPGVLILVREVYTNYSSEQGGGGGCCEYWARSSSSAAPPLLVSDFVRAGGNYDGLEYEIEDEASENNYTIDDEDEDDDDCENDSILASTCTAVDLMESLLQTVLPTSKSTHEIHQAAAASIAEHDDTTIPQHIDDYEILTMTTTTNDRVFGGGGSGSGMNSSGGTSSEDDLDDDPSFGGGGNSDGSSNNVNEEEEEEGGGGNDDEQRWIDTLFYEPGLGRKVLGTAGSWFLFDIVFYGNTIFQPIVVEAAFGGSDGTGNGITLIRKTAIDSLILTSIALPGYAMAGYVMGKQTGCILQTPRYVMLQGFLAMALLYGIIGMNWTYLQQKPSMLVFLYGLTFFFANYGPNTTTFILPSLLFDEEHRTTWNGVSAAAGKVGALVGATLFGPAADRYGDPTVMLICAGVALVAYLLTYLTIPQQQQQQQEEIEDDDEHDARQQRHDDSDQPFNNTTTVTTTLTALPQVSEVV